MEIDHGPALREKSKSYPKRFGGRTPKTIRMLQTVRPDMPFSKCAPALAGQEYPAWTNSHGAVCAISPDGERLGVKPAEFEIVEWFEADGVTVTRVDPTPEAPEWTGGPMSLERAIEINRGIQASTMARLVHGEHKPLPKCSLEELCAATRIVTAHRQTGGSGVGMTTDPRGIAAMYAFEHFGCDPHNLLSALGFHISQGDDAEESF